MPKFTIGETTYDLIGSKFTFAEARAIEKVTGHSFQTILSDPEVRGSIDATQALLWISMKRVEPTLTFSDLDEIEVDGIEWTEDAEEQAAPGGDAVTPTVPELAPVDDVTDAPPSLTSV